MDIPTVRRLFDKQKYHQKRRQFHRKEIEARNEGKNYYRCLNIVNGHILTSRIGNYENLSQSG